MRENTKKIEDITQLLQSMRDDAIHLMKDILNGCDITPAQNIVMHIIEKEKPSKMKSISDFLGISNSAVTQILGTLERKNIIRRKNDSKDKRSLNISITSRGRTLLKKVKKREIETTRKYLDALTKEEFDALAKIIKKISLKSL